MENVVEEMIKTLQVMIERKKRKLRQTNKLNIIKRQKLKGDIYKMNQELVGMVKVANGIRQ